MMTTITFVYPRQIVNNFLDLVTNFTISSIFKLYKVVFKVRTYFKSILNNDIKFIDVKEYTTFKIYNYMFIYNNKTYGFNYIIHKDDCSDIIDITDIPDIDALLQDTVNNIEQKDKNKQRILHVSLQNDQGEFLCDITKDLQQFKYYFDTYDSSDSCNSSDNEKNVTDNEKNKNPLYWKHIIHIIEKKYNTELNANKLYLYLILNDSTLTEKTLLLSSIINDRVLF